MEKLAISDVTLSFGGLKALSDVSLEIEPGLITSIIGPNGAGKTSLLNCISGFYHPTSGDILYGDYKLNKASPHRVSNLGIARAFQNIELFSGMSVLDNLMLARHQKLQYNILHAMVYFGKASREESKNRQYVEEVIDFMELEPYRKHTVGSLSYGIQKRVEVARALTLAPERAGCYGCPGGARPGCRHGHIRSHLRPRFRRADRRWNTGRGCKNSRGGRSLHWRRLTLMLNI